LTFEDDPIFLVMQTQKKAHCESNELFSTNLPLRAGEILLCSVKYASRVKFG